MKKRRTIPAMAFEMRTIPLSMIHTDREETEFARKELKARATYFMLNGKPVLSVNETAEGKISPPFAFLYKY